MKKYKHTELISNVLIVCMLGILLTATVTSGFYLKDKEVSAPITRGDTDEKKVSFLINVYWGTEYVIPMAEIIKSYGFNTTFFIGGCWASKNIDIVRQLHNMGYELGNHGYNHKNHGSLSYEENKKEIMVTENLLKSIISDKTSYLFAPPSGDVGENMYEFCSDYGFKVILWTRDTIDWRDKSCTLVYNRAINNLNNGDLILMHPTQHTLEALPKILDELKRQGYEVTTVSDII